MAPDAADVPTAPDPSPRDDGSRGEDPSELQRIRLVGGGALLLEEAGFRLIEPRGLRRSPVHPYASLTHVCLAARALLIGTTSGLLAIRFRDFDDSELGPARARDRLLQRVADSPDGAEQLHAMARVEALSAQHRKLWATWATAALCLLGTLFQLRDPLIDQIGSFVPALFARGELWRAVTMHFLHALPSEPGIAERLVPGLRGLPIHLAINVGGLFVLGPLVERPLGSWRTAIMLIAGGVGTIIGIVVAGHAEVLGASGLVAAMAGAILALELHSPETLPSDWRLPRRLFLVAIAVQFGIVDPLLRSFVAGGAHLGGFVGGYAATWWLGRPDVDGVEAPLRVRAAAILGLVSVAAASFGIVPLARHDEAALERHATRLLATPSDFHLYLHENAAAWFIATDGQATPEGLELAIALADRAAASTERLHPGVLDTLAEALFQSGNRLGAILTIDEAIRLVPEDPYFLEQRRRFTGERAADDRPLPPGALPPAETPDGDAPDPLRIDPEAPSITT